MLVCLFVSQVFKLLTDLKEQRKDSGKNKHSAGQQNLNTIMYEVSTRPLPLFTDLNQLHESAVSNVHCYSFFCISIQTLKYLSKMPCSRQSPDIVKDFLTTMMPHKLTKSVRSHEGIDVSLHQMKSITINTCTGRHTH